MTYKRPILGNTSVILFRLRTFGVGKTLYFSPFWIYNSTFWWPPLECSIRCLWINFNRFCIVFPFCLKTSFCFPSWYITIHGNFSIWNKLKLNYLRVKKELFFVAILFEIHREISCHPECNRLWRHWHFLVRNTK